jgi:hypothetical protein
MVDAAGALGVSLAGMGVASLVRMTGGVGHVGAAGGAAALALGAPGLPGAVGLAGVAWALAWVRSVAGDPWREAARPPGSGALAVGTDAVGMAALAVPPAWGAVPWIIGQALGFVALGRMFVRPCGRWPATARLAPLVGVGAAVLAAAVVRTR